MRAIVTVKLPRRADHDPRNKVTGPCPVAGANTHCTDVTGEHHSVLVEDMPDVDTVRACFAGLGQHVTRIEII